MLPEAKAQQRPSHTQMDTSSPSSSVDFYALLDIASTADLREVEKAYRKRALEVHPDKGGDPAAFRLLQAAYAALSDEGRRREYDEKRAAEADTVENSASETLAYAELLSSGDAVFEDGEDVGVAHACRCGGQFEVFNDDLPAGVSGEEFSLVIPCTHCSLHVEVVYVSA